VTFSAPFVAILPPVLDIVPVGETVSVPVPACWIDPVSLVIVCADTFRFAALLAIVPPVLSSVPPAEIFWSLPLY